MAIAVKDIIQQAGGLLDDDEGKSEYFPEPFWLRAVNAAVRQAYRFCYDATEYVFLLNTDIAITSGNVTAGDKSYPLPARTVYVSDYCDSRGDENLDKRPLLKAGSDATGTRLVRQRDYTVDSLNIVLTDAPVTTGNIEINYKQLPARILKTNQDIPSLPDYFEDFLVEYCVWYSERRLDDGRWMKDQYLMTLAQECRGILTDMDGRMRQFEPSWPADPDY